MLKGKYLAVVLILLMLNSPSHARSDEPVIEVVPKPASAKKMGGSFSLDSKTRIIAAEAEAKRLASLLNDYLLRVYGFKLQVEASSQDQKNAIIFSSDASLSEEGYRLTVEKKAIRLAGQKAGAFYGLQTLMQLLPAEQKAPLKIQGVDINDQPRFGYRGMHLDVGRHFFSVDFIKKYLDLMTLYKMNYFHWHLTEDQGWRIEIKKYPRLTEIGSKRKETVKEKNINPYVGDGIPHEGYYTQEQIKEVVAYARERFITVIPEIEMPGHARAALAAYPELSCAGGPFEVGTVWGIYKDVFCPKDETFKFLEDVLSEVIELFPSQFVHIGGDECPKDRWKECPHCQELIKREGLKDEHELQSYFIRRIEKFLNSKGKRLIGWDEILEGGLAPNATVMSWRGEQGGIDAARAAHDVIMTPTDYCYFDYGQGNPGTEPLNIGGFLPLRKVYNYNPVPKELKPEEGRYVLGAQGNVWTEYMKTPEKIEYMVFPRLLAIAESVWTPAERKDYGEFLLRLPHQFALLDRLNVNYRIPEPAGLEDAVVSEKDKEVKVQLTPLVAGAKIYYTTDGTDPDEKSALYEKPFKVALPLDQPVTLKTIVVASGGRRSVVYQATLARRSFKQSASVDANKQGLKYALFEGRFWNTRNLDQARPVVSGEVTSFDLAQFKRAENFGVVFEGYLKVPSDGLYHFALESNDGAVLIIDGEEVVNSDGPGPKEMRSGYAALGKGLHQVKLKFFQRGDNMGLRLLWAKKGQTLEPLDSNSLFH